jgi:cytochrome c oxidase assembly protein subunit 15
VFNTWPDIDGSLIPSAERLWFETPAWRNLFENNLTVQFNHRMMAYLLLVVAIWHSYDVASSTRDRYLRALASLFVSLVLVQAFIGIVTLLYSVPIPLALLHQAMAIVLLTIATLQAARLLQRQPIASQERGYAASA